MLLWGRYIYGPLDTFKDFFCFEIGLLIALSPLKYYVSTLEYLKSRLNSRIRRHGAAAIGWTANNFL